jgi:hypothetical protein
LALWQSSAVVPLLFSTNPHKPSTLTCTGPTLKPRAPTIPPPGDNPARAMVDNALNQLGEPDNPLV